MEAANFITLHNYKVVDLSDKVKPQQKTYIPLHAL